MQNSNSSCFSNILKVIEVLQKNTSNDCLLDKGCDRPFLGNINIPICYNTRPVTFYTSNGEILTANLTDGTTSSIFRVEKVSDNCVRCRILIPSENPTDLSPYVATNESISINLNCCCVLQCLPDVIVDNV